MKFKKLEVAGFKSFADKLEVKFGSGITGIVGPNGCGKSNVADSIRWVLGEQSAKQLRGSSMQDVIFNGTENRKSLSFCEVSLVFDNTEDENGDKLFKDLEYKEVVISRKLYRSGESEYLINSQSCRLRDIVELLRDGGMGREGYSIIGQGRIDQLLLAKPEDRRAIFEEAAGISKFKVKKVESERKLGRTEDNLSRVQDILDEKAKQLEPLTKQSENARKWIAIRDELKHYEINTYIHQFDSANEAKETINDRLNNVISELDKQNKESEEATVIYNEAMANLGNADTQISALREELLELSVGLEKMSGDIRVSGERRSHLVAVNDELNKENEKSLTDHANIVNLIANGESTLATQSAELETLVASVNEVTEKYRAVESELHEYESASDERHKKVVDAMEKLGDIKTNMGRLLAEKEALKSNIVDMQSRVDFYVDSIARQSSTVEIIADEVKKLVSQKAELVNAKEKEFEVNNNSLAVINDCATKLDKLSAQFHTTTTRHKMFKEMQEANESFGFAVKKLVSESKQNKELASRIEGVVASLIKVTSGYEVAVETALGNAVQNIVTKSEEEAKFLIKYLKDNRYGRATFLPMTSVKPRNIDDRHKSHLNTGGALGVATEYITYDKKYDSVLRHLLGGTVFAKDLESAVALAKKCSYNFKIVTLEGDVINPHGSITGGSKNSSLSNIFGYDAEISKLAESLKTMQVEIDSLTALRDKSSKDQAGALKLINELGEKIHSIDIDLASKNESLSKINEKLSQEQTDCDSLKSDITASTDRINAIDTDINSVSELENLVKTESETDSSTSGAVLEKFEALRKERNALNEEMLSAKLKVSELENNIRNFTQDISRLKDNSLALLETIENNKDKLEQNNKAIADIDAHLDSFSANSKEGDSGRVTEIRKKLANLDEFKAEVQEKLAVMESERNKVLEHIQSLHERKSREELQLLKVDSELEQMQIRIAEMYELDYEQCLPFKEEGYDVIEGEKVAYKLRSRMKFLGHVNLDSIELCKQVYESYHELEVQRDDLLKAKADLEKIIGELSKEMLDRFGSKFETIRVNFIKIFKELFNGGTADLLLLDSENPLDAGIEIVAQPPEKKLQSISLLSGGERALTAIAILFAILKLRPMPFCVLDEIEAALDDANAGRFAKYLRRFSEGTQFIVITHRKPTMELADALYGVTMEEKGVSKIVSVMLGEAVKVAEESK